MLANQYGIAVATIVRILRDCGHSLRSRSGSSALRANRKPGGSPQNGRYSVFQSKKNGKWIPASSTYEYVRMQQLEDDPNVIKFDRCLDRIQYVLGGRTRHYTPDITIVYSEGRDVVEEIKPKDLAGRCEVVAKAKAAALFYAGRDIDYRLVTEDEIGRDNLINFEWSGVTGLCNAEMDTWQKERSRKRATEWARKKRAATPMTVEQKAEHARRNREYQRKWSETATEEQKAAKRQRAAEQARKDRIKKKTLPHASNDNFEVEQFQVKTSTNA